MIKEKLRPLLYVPFGIILAIFILFVSIDLVNLIFSKATINLYARGQDIDKITLMYANKNDDGFRSANTVTGVINGEVDNVFKVTFSNIPLNEINKLKISFNSQINIHAMVIESLLGVKTINKSDFEKTFDGANNLTANVLNPEFIIYDVTGNDSYIYNKQSINELHINNTPFNSTPFMLILIFSCIVAGVFISLLLRLDKKKKTNKKAYIAGNSAVLAVFLICLVSSRIISSNPSLNFYTFDDKLTYSYIDNGVDYAAANVHFTGDKYELIPLTEEQMNEKKINENGVNTSEYSFLQSVKLKKPYQSTENADDYNIPKTDFNLLKPGDNPVQQTLIGYEGYAFLTETMKDYVRSVNLDPSNVDSGVRRLKNYAKWLKETYGTEFYLIVPPNKATVYSEYVPEGIKKVPGAVSRLEEFKQYLKDNTDINMVELLPDLIENKKDDLYYKLDSHWNENGGFVATNTLLNEIKKDFGNVLIPKKEDYRIEERETFYKDSAYYLGGFEWFTETGYTYINKRPATNLQGFQGMNAFGIFAYEHLSYPQGHPEGFGKYTDLNNYAKFTNSKAKENDAPTMLMIRDSFGVSMVPFLKDSFSESTFVWDWTGREHRDQIEKEKPDIVVMCVVERGIDELLK